jgi:hypothetical protein
MTGRDRIVIIGVVVLVVLGAAWIMVVSPERERASKLNAQVAANQALLSSAEAKLASARTAQSQYAAAYASLVNIGKAVPPTPEVPALIDQLTRASDQKSVEFSSITASSSGGSVSSASAAGAAGAGLSVQPFTFIFEGSFFDLEHLFRQLTDFATLNPAGQLQVSGRLLSIQSVRLSPLDSPGSTKGKGGAGNLAGTITASAYVLPASQGLTATATSSSPTGAATSASSSTTSAASSPTAPALVKVNP